MLKPVSAFSPEQSELRSDEGMGNEMRNAWLVFLIAILSASMAVAETRVDPGLEQQALTLTQASVALSDELNRISDINQRRLEQGAPPMMTRAMQQAMVARAESVNSALQSSVRYARSLSATAVSAEDCRTYIRDIELHLAEMNGFLTQFRALNVEANDSDETAALQSLSLDFIGYGWLVMKATTEMLTTCAMQQS